MQATPKKINIYAMMKAAILQGLVLTPVPKYKKSYVHNF